MANNKTGKFVDHEGRVVSVNNDRKLAEFLDTLSGSGGELQEDLTCTVDGGVGGVDTNVTFPAGTSLEKVLRDLLTGVPTLGISNLLFYSGDDGATGQLNTGNANPYPSGQELTLGSLKFNIADAAGVVDATGGTLEFGTNTALTVTGIATVDGTNTHDLAANVTVGQFGSDIPMDFNTARKVLNLNLSVTTSTGETLTANKQIVHAMPAFIVNVDASSYGGQSFFSTIASFFVSTGGSGLVTVISHKQILDDAADYRVNFAPDEANWSGNTNVQHFILIPSAVGAQPTGTTPSYEIPGLGPGSTSDPDLISVGQYTLDLSPAGYNLIADAGATAAPYQVFYWKNASSLTSSSSFTLT